MLFDQRMRDLRRALRPRGSGLTSAFQRPTRYDFIIETHKRSEELRNRFGSRCGSLIVGGWEDQVAGVGSVRKSFPQPVIVSGAWVAALIDQSSTWFA